jgi:transcriptional regulator with XRE-family HTH domain
MPRTAISDILARDVGTELRRARLRQGLTQLQLGTRLGTSGSYIANVEAGRENLTLGQMANIAQALDASLEISFPMPERAPVKVPEAPQVRQQA